MLENCCPMNMLTSSVKDMKTIISFINVHHHIVPYYIGKYPIYILDLLPFVSLKWIIDKCATDQIYLCMRQCERKRFIASEIIVLIKLQAILLLIIK